MSEDIGGAVIQGARQGMAIAQTIANVFSALVQVLSRPFALLTQALFRKDMGERYFTFIHAAIGAWLIGLAVGVSQFLPALLHATGLSSWNQGLSQGRNEAPPIAVSVIGLVWLFAFLIAYSRHRVAVRNRHKKNIRWHSYNSGVPRIPRLTPIIEYTLIGCLAVVAFYTGLYAYGVLLAVSLICGVIDERLAAQRFWSAVLDVIDAEIEAKNLASAIANAKPPRDAEGLEAPIPAKVSLETRKRIAAAFGEPPEPEIVVKNGLMPTAKPDPAHNEVQPS